MMKEFQSLKNFKTLSNLIVNAPHAYTTKQRTPAGLITSAKRGPTSWKMWKQKKNLTVGKI
jgi:hypothetical protein